MNWIYLDSGDAFNFNNIAHIWIQKCPSGFFLMGKMIHNQEEGALTHIFDSFDECKNIIRKICRCNQVERIKTEDDCFCNYCEKNKSKDQILGFICKQCMEEM